MEENKKQSATEKKDANQTTDNTKDGASAATNKSKLGLVLGALAAGAILAGGYFYFENNQITNPAKEESSAVTLEEIADDQVVAKVDGQEILGSELNPQVDMTLQQIAAMEYEINNDIVKEIRRQTLETLINSKLILAAAKDSGIEVSSEEVEAEFSSIVTEVGSMEEVEAQLAQMGTNVEEFKVDMADNLLIQKYIDSTLDPEMSTVTEEEVETFYDQMIANSAAAEEVPTLEEVREQIVDQLKSQKQQDALFVLLEELRAAVEVEVLL